MNSIGLSKIAHLEIKTEKYILYFNDNLHFEKKNQFSVRVLLLCVKQTSFQILWTLKLSIFQDGGICWNETCCQISSHSEPLKVISVSLLSNWYIGLIHCMQWGLNTTFFIFPHTFYQDTLYTENSLNPLCLEISSFLLKNINDVTFCFW